MWNNTKILSTSLSTKKNPRNDLRKSKEKLSKSTGSIINTQKRSQGKPQQRSDHKSTDCNLQNLIQIKEEINKWRQQESQKNNKIDELLRKTALLDELGNIFRIIVFA